LRYNPAEVGDLGRVVAPPYDVIRDEELDEFRARSPFNVVRLTRPGDDYEAAAALLRDWIEQGVLADDSSPRMYLHEVRFDGRRRRDLVAALRLQPYEDEVVLPHERTHRGPKEDRLKLYRATATALEPLWFLYQGAGTHLPKLLEEGFSDPPQVSFRTPEGRQHLLWLNQDDGWQRAVRASFSGLQVLIADGHHRYETALSYAEQAGGPANASSRFTLALLTDLNDPGLQLLPTHRVMKAGIAVIGGERASSLEGTLAALRGRVAAGAYRSGEYQVLPLEGEVPVLELHRQVIDNILGKRSAEENLMYTRDAGEAVRWVDEGRGVAAFLLEAPDPRRVLKLAQAGTTLPQKSTYFHPKPPSGMVFHRLDQERTL
jgi:uncharacterized protein (DUF1015 family)